MLRECSPPTTCHLLGVRCQVFFYFYFLHDNMLDLCGGGSVFNEAYPVYFYDGFLKNAQYLEDE